jgi:hypothetical protein
MAIKTIQKAQKEEVKRNGHEAEQRAAGSSDFLNGIWLWLRCLAGKTLTMTHRIGIWSK